MISIMLTEKEYLSYDVDRCRYYITCSSLANIADNSLMRLPPSYESHKSCSLMKFDYR